VKAQVVLVPGYGAAVTQPLLVRLERLLAPLKCLRLQVPTHPRDESLSAQVAVLRQAIGRRRVVLVGRSFGARVVVRYANRYGAKGVVALSYPLRGAKPRPIDKQEVQALQVPSLFISGDRDPQAPVALLAQSLSEQSALRLLPGAGHGYGSHTAKALEAAANAVRQWAASPLRRGPA
jgi:pimeloyl-ACP methyl ester carboxylesterase